MKKKSKHINLTIETDKGWRKGIKESRQLNVLVEGFLANDKATMKRCCAVGKLIQSADMVTETNLYPSMIQGVTDAAFALAKKAGQEPVFRITVSNSNLRAYFIGSEAKVKKELEKSLGIKKLS